MKHTSVDNPDMSPVISLRGIKETKIDFEPGNTSFIPRACMSRGYIPESLIKRKRSSSLKIQRHTEAKKVHAQGKNKTTCIFGMLSIEDVNSIDRCSRLLFPGLFLIVNLLYWGYYLVL